MALCLLQTQGAAQWPAVPCDAHVDGFVNAAEASNQLTKRDALAVELDKDGVFPSSVLFGVRGPAAVLFRVAKRGVDAVNGVFGSWREAHVVGEPLKKLPLFAQRNASPAVAFVPVRFWVLRSLFYGAPDAVQALFRRHFPSRGSLVRRLELAGVWLFFGAAARGGSANALKAGPMPDNGITAVAQAQPSGRPRFGRSLADHGQPANSLANQVKFCSHVFYCNRNISCSEGGVF